LLCSLYEDCNKRIIKKSLNLAAKGYKVIKKDDGRAVICGDYKHSLSLGSKGGQASSEDLLPLGYGERDRARVRVKFKISRYYAAV
jgi:hypothetical protein